MQKFINNLVKNAIAKQRKAYAAGHDNQGASIDVLALVRGFAGSIASNDKNQKAATLEAQVELWNAQNENVLNRGFQKELDHEVITFIAKEVFRFVSNAK